MVASASLTGFAPHFCYTRWRFGSSLRSHNLVETREFRSKRYIRRIDQKAILTISNQTIKFRCKAVTTTMEVTIENETLLTDKEADIIAAATQALALARTALEVSKEAIQLFHTNPNNSSNPASESVPETHTKSTILALESALNPFPHSSPSNAAFESLLNPSAYPKPSPTALKSVPNPFDSDPGPSILASELLLTELLNPLEDPIEDEDVPLNNDDVAVKVGSTRHKERKEKRQRATDKWAARVVPVRSYSRRKRKQKYGTKDPLTKYRRIAGRYKNLTIAQERELSLGVQDLLKLKDIQKQLTGMSGTEPSFEMWAAAAQVDQKTLQNRVNHGKKCQETMIKSNIRLVISIAKKYRSNHLSFEDLVQEGCRGLSRALEKFDSAKGFKFSTYAHWWIRQAIQKGLTERSRLIDLPAYMVNASYKVKMAIKEMKCAGLTEKKFEAEDIAKASGLSKKMVDAVLLLPKAPISLYSTTGFDSTTTLEEILPGREEDTPDYLVKKECENEGIRAVVDTLHPREQQVVRWRYGFEGDGRCRTLQEIGDMIGISRERVRQIENCALRKLKSKKRVELLKQYL